MAYVAPPDFVSAAVVTEAQLDNLSNNLKTGVMRPLAEVTLRAPANIVDFESIPSTFRSLMLVAVARGDAAAGNVEMFARINNVVVAGTYHSQGLFAAGTTPSAFEYAGTMGGIWMGQIPAASSGSSIMFGAAQMIAFDYANNSSMKNFRTVNYHRYGGAGQHRIYHIGGTWDNGNTITRITLFLGSGNFVNNSRFTLYGLPA
jgi:hypothetical protein